MYFGLPSIPRRCAASNTGLASRSVANTAMMRAWTLCIALSAASICGASAISRTALASMVMFSVDEAFWNAASAPGMHWNTVGSELGTNRAAGDVAKHTSTKGIGC